MSERSKMIPADLVAVSADRIQEAMDFLVTSRSSSVNLLVFNGLCIGIDTARPSKQPKPDEVLQLVAPAKSATANAGRFNRQDIIDIVSRATKPLTAFDIGNTLGLASNDKSGRARMTYFLGVLKRDRTLLHHGVTGTYSLSKRHESSPRVASPGRVTRDKVTEEAVLAIITRLGQANSSRISEELNIPVTDASVRNKVSVVLSFLRSANQIEAIEDGNKYPRGGVPYALASNREAVA